MDVQDIISQVLILRWRKLHIHHENLWFCAYNGFLVSVISPLCSQVRELQNNLFKVLLKDTSAGQTLADAVAWIQFLQLENCIHMHRTAA